jgi:tetratricopeptide (TPR) repeat protein
MSCSPKFSVTKPGCDRIHHVTEEDVGVLLSRLPTELWRRLRAVHFNDQGRGARRLGYVNRGRREIALCALPPRVSLNRFLSLGRAPESFGARRGCQWPAVAIRRFMLYEVFLHELGHLQVIHADATDERRKYAMETKAQEFAMGWCKRLWSEPFDHPDPIHNPPSEVELTDEDSVLSELTRLIGLRPDDANLFQLLGKLLRERGRREEARMAFERSIALDPNDPWTHLYLGNWHYTQEDFLVAIESFSRAAKLLPNSAVGFWCLANAHEALGQIELADANYRKAVEVEPRDKQARRQLRAWQERSRGIPV